MPSRKAKPASIVPLRITRFVTICRSVIAVS
jgi:hypothetical protein